MNRSANGTKLISRWAQFKPKQIEMLNHYSCSAHSISGYDRKLVLETEAYVQ